MDTVSAKVIALIALLVLTLLFGLLPRKALALIGRFRRRRGPRDPCVSSQPQSTTVTAVAATADGRLKTAIDAVSAFGGGVLFATCFVHLLPELREEFEVGLGRDSEILHRFPLGELVVCAGFFFTYAVEELVEYFVCRSCKHQSAHHHKPVSPENGDEEDDDDEKKKKDPKNGTDDRESPTDHGDSPSLPLGECLASVHVIHGAHREHVHLCGVSSSDDRNGAPARENPIHGASADGVTERIPLRAGDEVGVVMTSSADDCQGRFERCSNMAPVSNVDDVVVFRSPSHNYGTLPVQPLAEPRTVGPRSTLRGLVMIAALSFHSLFEGMAIGLQPDEVSVWTSFVAIAVHKLVIAFCVGMELVMLGTPRLALLLYVGTFAAISPLGVGIGTLVTEAPFGEAGVSTVTVAVLQSIATGTLLYVTFFEVLTRTKAVEGTTSFVNFVTVLLGFSLIVAMHTFHDHGHSHGHEAETHT